MNTNIKKSVITIISITIVLAIALSITGIASSGFTNWNTNAWFKRETVKFENNTSNDFAVIPNNNETMTLSVSKPYVLAASDYTKSIDLKATVYPAETPFKSADWHIEWADNSVTLTLSEYMRLTPQSDGSLNATLTCYKPFNNDIVVTVVTRSGGQTATCMVTYVGAPESVSITGNGISTVSDAGIGAYYPLSTGGAFTFNLSANNNFGDVRTACNYTYSVSASGNIIVQNRKHNGNNMTNTWEGTESTVAIKDITAITSYVPSAFDCSVSGNTLSIKSNSTLAPYYSSSQRAGQVVMYYDSFKSYQNDNWYYTVTVTETNSGVSQTIKLRPIASVSNISLNNTVVGF